jgi:hypothetical protein
MNKRALILIPPLLLAALWWLSNMEPEPAVSAVADASAAQPSQQVTAPPRSRSPRPSAESVSPEDTGAPLARALPPATEDTGDTGEALPPPLVTVTLVDTNGAPVEFGMVTSPECNIWLWAGEEPTTFVAPEGLCAFQGRRKDGLLWGRSEWVDLELLAGDEVSLELVIPIERTGGLGVMILEHEFGIEVQQVWPGTPAAEMGLEAGDIITEVDGLPSSALTMDEFIQVMTGPVGTDVSFALAYEEDTGITEEEITLTRAWLE